MYKVDAQNNEYEIFLESIFIIPEKIKAISFIDENSRSKEQKQNSDIDKCP